MADALPHDPFEAFATWYAEAERSEARVPDAVQLATVSADGRPHLRTVLLKSFGRDGFVFYTNLESRKGRDLQQTPDVALLLHWKSRERQVVVDGRARPVSDAEADAYFATRPRGSQLGAWASDQSRPLADRATLEARMDAAAARFEGLPVPRPPHWSGFRVTPRRIEFWQGRADRLHERTVWTWEGDHWFKGLLYP